MDNPPNKITFLTPTEFGRRLNVLIQKTQSAGRVRKTYKAVIEQERDALMVQLAAQYAMMYKRARQKEEAAYTNPLVEQAIAEVIHDTAEVG